MCSLLFEAPNLKSLHVSTYSENQNGTSAGIGVAVNFFIIFYFNRKWGEHRPAQAGQGREAEHWPAQAGPGGAAEHPLAQAAQAGRQSTSAGDGSQWGPAHNTESRSPHYN